MLFRSFVSAILSVSLVACSSASNERPWPTLMSLDEKTGKLVPSDPVPNMTGKTGESAKSDDEDSALWGLLFLGLLGAASNGNRVNPNYNQVSPYYNNNGTYVSPYYRTNPNSSVYDNYGNCRNVNPWTGRVGYGKCP